MDRELKAEVDQYFQDKEDAKERAAIEAELDFDFWLWADVETVEKLLGGEPE